MAIPVLLGDIRLEASLFCPIPPKAEATAKEEENRRFLFFLLLFLCRKRACVIFLSFCPFSLLVGRTKEGGKLLPQKRQRKQRGKEKGEVNLLLRPAYICTSARKTLTFWAKSLYVRGRAKRTAAQRKTFHFPPPYFFLCRLLFWMPSRNSVRVLLFRKSGLPGRIPGRIWATRRRYSCRQAIRVRDSPNDFLKCGKPHTAFSSFGEWRNPSQEFGFHFIAWVLRPSLPPPSAAPPSVPPRENTSWFCSPLLSLIRFKCAGWAAHSNMGHSNGKERGRTKGETWRRKWGSANANGPSAPDSETAKGKTRRKGGGIKKERHAARIAISWAPLLLLLVPKTFSLTCPPRGASEIEENSCLLHFPPPFLFLFLLLSRYCCFLLSTSAAT